MTLVTIDLGDVAGGHDPDDHVIIRAEAFRESPGGGVTSTAEVKIPLADGVGQAEVEPGPVVVSFRCQAVADTREKRGVVPETGPVGIEDVIGGAFEYTPPVVNRGIAQIEEARDEALGQVEGAVAAEIGDFRSGLVPPTVVNLWDYDASTVQTMNTQGTPLDHESHRLSPFIPVDGGEKYIGRAGEATEATGRFFRALFFDNTFTLIPGQDTSWTEQGETRNFVAPDTAKWVRIVANPGEPPRELMIFNRGDTLWTPDANTDSGWWDDRELPPNPLAGELDELRADLDEFPAADELRADLDELRAADVPPAQYVENLWDYSATTPETMSTQGTVLDHERHRLSPFMPVVGGEQYVSYHMAVLNHRVIFFDSTYSYIPGTDTSWLNGEQNWVAPPSAAFARMVIDPGDLDRREAVFNRGAILFDPDDPDRLASSGWWDDRELPPNPLAGELDIVTGNRLLQEVPPKLPTNLWDDSAKTIGLLSTIGTVVESENNWVSHYIPVTPGRPYQSMVLSVNAIGDPVWSELRIVWFHADYSYIPGTDTNRYEGHMSWVAPADARFVRVGVSRGGGQTTTVIFNEGETLLDLDNPGAPSGYWDERESPEIPRSKPGGVAGLDLGGNVVNAAGDRVLTKVESDERYATIGSGGGMPAHLRPDPATPAFTVGPATDKVTGLVRYPAGELSPDGTLMLSGRGSTGLFRSFDDGDTWESVHAFPYTIHGVRFLGNGEVMVSTISGVDPGELWVSDGWAVNNLTAVWTKVLTTPYGQNHINGSWGMSVWRNFVFVSEYGSDDETDAARHAWLSTDYGKTFEVVFDLLDMYPAEDRDGLHVHGCAIDPYEPGGRPRLWVAHGDTIDGVFYSDDLGDTWLPVEWDGPKVQQVGIHAMPNGVLFTSDASPQGIYRVPRGTNMFATPRAELTHQILPEDSSLTVLGTGHYQSPREGAPLLLPFGVVSFTNNPRAAMLLATVDGEHFYELWRDDVAPTSLLAVVGPTASGKLVGVINDSSRHGTPRSKLVIDAPEWVPVSTGL